MKKANENNLCVCELDRYKKHFPGYAKIFESAFQIVDQKLAERWNIIKNSIDVDKKIIYRQKFQDDLNWYSFIGNVLIQDIKDFEKLLSDKFTKSRLRVFINKYYSRRRLERIINLIAVGFYSAYQVMFVNRIQSDGKTIPGKLAEVYTLIVKDAGELDASKNFRKICNKLFDDGKLQKTGFWLDVVRNDSVRDQKIILINFKDDVAEDFRKWYKLRIKKRKFTNRQILNELNILKQG